MGTSHVATLSKPKDVAAAILQAAAAGPVAAFKLLLPPEQSRGDSPSNGRRAKDSNPDLTWFGRGCGVRFGVDE